MKETLANNNNIKELEGLTNGVGNRAGWARFCVRRVSSLIVLVVLAVVVVVVPSSSSPIEHTWVLMSVCERNSECECLVRMVRVVDLADLLQQCSLPTPHAALSDGVKINIMILCTQNA